MRWRDGILTDQSRLREHEEIKNITSLSQKNFETTARFRLLGFLPLTFFLAQAVHYWQINEFGHTLWMCNIGNLLLAVGLFIQQPTLIRVAAIWMVPGVAVWFGYVVPTWGTLATGQATASQLFGVLSSTLAHLGGFSVGMLVLRRIRMDGRAWLLAFAWYFVIQLLSRLTTPVPLNINVSQHIQPGWEQTFNAYWKFWLVLTLLVGICLWVIGSILRLVWPVKSQSREASPGPL